MHHPLPESCARHYAPVRLLAAGAHGEVWLATQKGLEREAVVKLLRPQTAEVNADLLERFRNEAVVTAALRHPGIVVLLDHGADAGGAWIAYEYIAGGSLADRLAERGPLPWQQALDVVQQVARALAVAHAAGVVHRDVKPANVLVAGEDSYRLADFGVAHWSELSGSRTLAGQVLGSPAYLSPELRFGAPATPAADVFALGITALELITGKTPDGLLGHADAPRTDCWLDLEDRTPPEVAALVERLTAPALTDRLAEAAPLAEEADRLLTADATSSLVRRRPRRAVEDAPGPVPRARGPTRPAGVLRRSRRTRRTAPSHRPALAGVWAAVLVALALIAIAVWREPARELPAPGPSPRASAVEDPLVELLDTVRRRVEREPIALTPWYGRDADRAGGWPLVLACRGHIEEVVLRPPPGARVRAIDGRPAKSSAGEPVRLTPAEIRAGVLFVEVEGARPGDRVTVDVKRGPCPVRATVRAAPPSLALLGDELRRRFSEIDDHSVEEVKRLTDRELAGRDEPYRRAVHALIDLREAAFWEQRWSQRSASDAFLASSDEYWSGEALTSARQAVRIVEALLPDSRDPATGWLELGSILRLCRQPQAARAALVESLTAWPDSHWAWLELAKLEKGLGEQPQDPPLTAAEREAHLTLSLPAFDTAARLMSQRFARRRDDERFWISHVQGLRSDVVQLIGRCREEARRGGAGL